MTELLVALFAFLGAIGGVVLSAQLRAEADRAERRWRFEMDALSELGSVLSRLAQAPVAIDQPFSDREVTKVRVAALAHAVRDPRPRQVIEPMLAETDGSQTQRDAIGDCVRVVGVALRDLGGERPPSALNQIREWLGHGSAGATQP
jgi:hypothetical protein